MKSIKQWLMENSSEIHTVDLARIFGGSSIQIDPRLYSKVRTKVDQILKIIESDPELSEESKTEVFRQLIAVMAKELVGDAVSGKTVSSSKLAGGFSGTPDEPIAREM